MAHLIDYVNFEDATPKLIPDDKDTPAHIIMRTQVGNVFISSVNLNHGTSSTRDEYECMGFLCDSTGEILSWMDLFCVRESTEELIINRHRAITDMLNFDHRKYESMVHSAWRDYFEEERKRFK